MLTKSICFLQLVVSNLLKRGPQTLKEIVRGTGNLLCPLLPYHSLCSLELCAVHHNSTVVSAALYAPIAACAEFPHLADSSPKEKGKETDRITRAVLVAMLQFSLVKAYRIQPEPTARNLNPEPYWQYEADVYAILRIHRCENPPR